MKKVATHKEVNTMTKKQYESVELETVRFKDEDVIRTSGQGGDTGTNNGVIPFPN